MNQSQKSLEIKTGKLSPLKNLVGRTPVIESGNLPNRKKGIRVAKVAIIAGRIYAGYKILKFLGKDLT